jgi:hypothetical protein
LVSRMNQSGTDLLTHHEPRWFFNVSLVLFGFRYSGFSLEPSWGATIANICFLVAIVGEQKLGTRIASRTTHSFVTRLAVMLRCPESYSNRTSAERDCSSHESRLAKVVWRGMKRLVCYLTKEANFLLVTCFSSCKVCFVDFLPRVE